MGFNSEDQRIRETVGRPPRDRRDDVVGGDHRAPRVRLENICERSISGEWGIECSPDSGVWVLRTTNFRNDGTLDFTDVVRRAIREDKISEKKLVEGDIIIEKSGGTKDHPVGRVVYFPVVEGTYLCNNFTQVLRPDKEVVAPRFLFYTLRAFYDMKVTESLYNKTTGIQNLQMKKYLQLEIPLPPLPAQREIAAELDRICAMKKNAEERVEICQQLVKSKFVECFGDPVTNKMSWPVYRLGERCEIITGNTPSRADAGNYGSYIEWIKSDNIVNGRLTEASESLSQVGFKKSRNVAAGAILMTCIAGSVNSIGNCAIVDRKVAFNQQINAVVPTGDDPRYLLWMFKLARTILHEGINNCLKGILSKSGLAGKMFPFPPLPLQREFAAYVAKVEKMEAVAREMVTTADMLYRAKLQEYFG